MYRYNTYIVKCIMTFILIRSSYISALQIYNSLIFGVKLKKSLATIMQTTCVSTEEKGLLHNVSFGIQNMSVFTFLKI